MGTRNTFLLSIILLCGLSACQREATGQVVAIVNGEEITQPELNAEIASLQIPDSADQDMVRQQALQRIVDRRLLAQASRDDGLDASQDYLIRERLLRDNLLVQLLRQRIERTASPPDQEEVDQYINENPGFFAERKIYSIDRIRFPTPSDFSVLSPLENDHSIAAAEETLVSLGIDFQRDEAQIDSAVTPAELLQQLADLPEGEPFVVPESGVVTLGVITGEQTVPLTGEEARPLALRMLSAKQVNDAIQQRLQQAQVTAEVEYQDGFAPTETSSSDD